MEPIVFIQIILLPFCIALLCVGITHPIFVRLARMKDIVDLPNARKLQRMPVPILGGSCVFLGVVIGVGFSAMWVDCSLLFMVILAMTVMLYTGTGDDILGLSPRVRFLIEILTVLFLIGVGDFMLNDFHGLWGVGTVAIEAAIPLTILASVGIINAINLIDGVDGLSSGFCVMASIVFGTLFYLAGDVAMALLAAVSAGALVPFFFHNVYGRSSKMFIGDGGTLVLGVVMSVFVLRTLQQGAPCGAYVDEKMGLVPFTLAVLAVPVFDTLRVMTARILRGKSPFQPDKTHLHHLFIDLGFSHAGTTIMILALNTLVIMCWWGSYAWGASVDLQLYIVLGLNLLVTTGLYYGVRRLSPSSGIGRFLRHLGTLTHVERTGWVLRLQRMLDRL